MNRTQAEHELIELLGDPMRVLGKPTVADGDNSYVGPAIGLALSALGLPVDSTLEPTDAEVAGIPADSIPRFLKLGQRELARRLYSASVAKVQQQIGRDSEVHWQQMREGLESLLERLDAELEAVPSGGGRGAWAAGPLRTGESPPRATLRDWR